MRTLEELDADLKQLEESVGEIRRVLIVQARYLSDHNSEPAAEADAKPEQPKTNEAKHTPGPWRWTVGFGNEPQLEGNVKWPEMNPILCTTGCGNDKPTDSGIEGCMPEKLDDPLRACPLHPTAEDRALIAVAPDLLAACEEGLKELKAVEDHALKIGGWIKGNGCIVLEAAILKAKETDR